jgi:hypothetical protein
MSVDAQQKNEGAQKEPAARGPATISGPRGKDLGGKTLNNNLVGVQQFDMTEDEVRLWDTRVGMVVGLLLLVGAGSALVFGTIKLINWLNA